MDLLTVRATGLPVPREGVRETIDATPATVPNTHYYRRRIARGELVEVAAAPAPAKKES